jgi:hypothetical protein
MRRLHLRASYVTFRVTLRTGSDLQYVPVRSDLQVKAGKWVRHVGLRLDRLKLQVRDGQKGKKKQLSRTPRGQGRAGVPAASQEWLCAS